MSSTSGNTTLPNLDNLPAAAPPPGVVPNYANPPSAGPALIITSSIFFGLMLFFFFIRIYTKVKLSHKLTPDDYTCIVGTVGAAAYYVVIILAVTIAPFGKHIWDLTAADLVGKGFAITGYVSNWSTALIWPFIKITFFLFYLQLFRPMVWIRYCCYAGIFVTAAFYISILVATLVFTSPAPGESWIEQDSSHRQARSILLAVPTASVNLVLDVYILLLPLAGLKQLQLTPRRRLGVSAIFLTGIMACIASSMSIYYKVQLDKHTLDVTYEVMPVLLTCFLEMSVGIIASCMPAMSKFYRSTAGFGGLLSSLPFSRFTVRSTASASRNKNYPTSESEHNSKIKRAHYASFGAKIDDFVPYDSDTVQMNTYVGRAEPQDIKDSSIHMQYSVTQDRSTGERVAGDPVSPV